MLMISRLFLGSDSREHVQFVCMEDSFHSVIAQDVSLIVRVLKVACFDVFPYALDRLRSRKTGFAHQCAESITEVSFCRFGRFLPQHHFLVKSPSASAFSFLRRIAFLVTSQSGLAFPLFGDLFLLHPGAATRSSTTLLSVELPLQPRGELGVGLCRV